MGAFWGISEHSFIFMATILVLNGPNLNLLGVREPGLYGSETLEDIEGRLRKKAGQSGIELHFFQTNAEHELIGYVHEGYRSNVDCVIINPGAFTHTSIALRDAFLATKLPFIEIHLSNVHARESFRQHSYLSDIARGVILGFGPLGYELAFDAAIAVIKPDQGR
ncbi:MAG: type 3-dehydroquinate dehydratase [Pseudomonadota bacterium]|jgi:3-dehydroquinate dehydratase-2